MKNLRITIALITLLCLSFSAFAQQYVPEQFNHGNNENYTPFTNFAAPVAKPTPLDDPPPITGKIANKEKDVATKSIKGANAGIHFPEDTKGVKTVRYDLYVTDSTVNYTGKKRHGLAVNGSNPAPTLNFTIGDTAVIYVHNLAKEPTSIHWHGVQLPNRMDGVPYLTQKPIPPHSTYIYKFPVVQSGTHLYHSHFALQEQIGLTGAMIFNKRTEPDIPTIPVVLTDWSDTKPEEIQRLLKTDNDWFDIKKRSVQSYWEALKQGQLGTKFVNEWKRMEAMDVSDVYYEQFQLNGDSIDSHKKFKAGDKVRLRVVNGSASSYFWLTYSGGKIKVIANDGNDVKPVDVDRLLIGVSETYDVVVTVPENKQFEFRATAEDRSGYASLLLGEGEKVRAKKLPKLKYFEGMKMMNGMMKMNGDMESSEMKMTLQEMDMNEVMYPEVKDDNHDMKNMDHDKHDRGEMDDSDHDMKDMNHNGHKMKEMGHGKDEGQDNKNTASDSVTLNYNKLESTENTTLEGDNWKELEFELTGNMNRYVWSLDNKTVDESDKIPVRQGENLRVILKNNSMMRHPMHLHGHDFRLLNQFDEKSPLKNVVDVMPMETDTLEFKASESGDWFFHCHILYHMTGGMGRVFENVDDRDTTENKQDSPSDRMLNSAERRFYLSAENEFASNSNSGDLTLDNTRWGMKADWRLGYKDEDGYEVTSKFGRYFGNKQWLFPYVGVDWRYEKNSIGEKNWFGQAFNHDRRIRARLGFQYTLPWLIVADAGINHKGHVLLEITREDIPLSSRLRGSFMFNSDKEARFGLNYIVFKNFGISANYDTDFGWGAGIKVIY